MISKYYFLNFAETLPNIHSRTKIFARPKPNLPILQSLIFQQEIDLHRPAWARLKAIFGSFKMTL